MSDLELPALNIVAENRERTQAIQQFLEEMAEKGYCLTKERDDMACEPHEVIESVIPTSGPQLNDHLYEFIGTDAKTVEKERQMLLANLGG